ncbi:ATP-grasp domain-containing protein [Nocardia gipuzkoensis]|uniref:ATP-grasp domain-containing protein n=1 Tax=Nocardia gipuzkoensis TaxID=2749991 RepID=UPI00237E3CF8|nr:ATP-grasp domain-containing protein [Nocardia gipuzkoensis]MDE1675332.1 ATP-grasp domain-containing protein [Nocardia gipuzkoensis]
MYYLVLNRLDLASTPFDDWLGPGHNAVVLSGIESAPDEVGAKLAKSVRTELQIVDEFESAAVEYLALELHQNNRFDEIITFSELDLLRAARLREAMGIDGQTVVSAASFRDKVLMKDLLSKGGIPVATYVQVRYATDLIGFARHNGYPIVVKPRYGAGSVGVEVLHTEDSLYAYLKEKPELGSDPGASLIAERYVDHKLYHVDGIVAGEKTALMWPSRMTSCLGYRTGEALLSCMLGRTHALHSQLCAITQSAITTLPTPGNAVFHAEVFECADGSLLLNEIACRPGGGRVISTINEAFDINLIKLYVQLLSGSVTVSEIPSNPKRSAGFVCFPPRPGVVRQIPSKCPLESILQYRTKVKPGDILHEAAHSVDNIASAVAVGNSAEEVEHTLRRMVEWFSEGLVIESLAT